MGSCAVLAAFCAACFAAFFVGIEYFGTRPNFEGAALSRAALYAVSAGIFALLSALVFIGFWAFLRQGLKRRRLLVLACLVLFVTYCGSITAGYLTLYALPACVAAVIIAHLLDTRLGFVCNIVMMLFVLHFSLGIQLSQQSAEGGYAAIAMPVCVWLLYGCILAFQVGQNVPRLQFVARLFLNTLFVLPIVILFLFLNPSGVRDDVLLEAGIGFLMQFAFPLILIPVLEFAFNLTTNNRLIILGDYRRPLLARLAAEAPATFNHSQTVGNFAESCAGAIGENVYFARAAAMYHDVGKLGNVQYYTENQGGGPNPHDNIPPELSAEIIRRHAEDGYEMARRAGVPEEVAIICREHHGTMPMAYFLDKALKMTDDDTNFDPALYSYKGPIPSGKIAAIIMICDSAEAMIRAVKTNDRHLIAGIVQKIIHERIEAGQFDNCGITLQELAIIRRILVDFSAGVFHKRIKYPGQGGLLDKR